MEPICTRISLTGLEEFSVVKLETTNANKFKNNEDKCQGELRTLNSDVSDADY